MIVNQSLHRVIGSERRHAVNWLEMTEVISGPDPFRLELKLEVKSVYYPLGFPLELATNSTEINKAAEQSWGRYPRAFEKPPLRVRVHVEVGGGRPAAPHYREQEHLMTITADAENFALCDPARAFAFCHLNREAARDTQFAGDYFLQAIANYCLTQLYLTPVQGACIARDKRGVLLCGPSGAGKTSLAYYCARNGWTYVSDNPSWLVREGGGRLLVGDPHRVRFHDTARELFPELQGRDAVADADGTMSIAITLAGPGIAYQCCVEQVVLLARQPDGPATLRRLASQQVFDRFLSELPVYDSRVREEQCASLEKIAGLNSVELRYSSLEDALGQLESLLFLGP